MNAYEPTQPNLYLQYWMWPPSAAEEHVEFINAKDIHRKWCAPLHWMYRVQ